MPAEWVLGIVLPIFIGKCGIRNCSCNGVEKRLEHAVKVVEKVFEKRLCRIVSVDEMQFGFMPGSRTIDAISIFRRMQEKYHAKGKKVVYELCGPRESF